MAYTLISEFEGAGAMITFTGNIKPDEVLKLHEEIFSHPDLSKWRYQIWDFSKAGDLDFTMEDLRRFAMAEREMAPLNSNQKIALIPRPLLYQGFDNMFQVYESVWGICESKTFQDVDSARIWAQNGWQSNPKNG
jgi:hypothetical protein